MENRCKIVIELHPGDVASAETLWAVQIDMNQFELQNIPALAFGVNLGDIIRAKRGDDGRYYFEDVIKRSGHRTLRVAANENAQERLDTLRAMVKSNGGQMERSDDAYFAIDIPPGAEISDLIDFLEDGERADDWEWEESGLADVADAPNSG